MMLRDDELRGLPVTTTTGACVGTLVGFVIEADSGTIAQFRVRPPGILAMLASSRELLIHQSQVVSLDAKGMVVHGGGATVNRRDARRFAAANQPQPATSALDHSAT